VNRKVARRSTDVTDPTASALDTKWASEATAVPPAPAEPDGITPGIARRAGPDRAGSDRTGMDRALTDRALAEAARADRIGVDHAGRTAWRLTGSEQIRQGPIGRGPIDPQRTRPGPIRAGRITAGWIGRVWTGGGRRDRRRSRRGFALVLAVLVVLALVPLFVARIYVIPSGSMETTLHGCAGCDNDRVLVEKLVYRFGAPVPGDVVVFTLPDTWTSAELRIPHGGANPVAEAAAQLGSLVGLHAADETIYIKRVIAVGGQTVACCDDRNRIIVDGVALDEPYIYFMPEAGPPRQSPFGPVRVPEGELWVMGDSRNDSVDSRADGNGPVPVADVIGKARFVVWPFDRVGGIDDGFNGRE
jgi:signal peptidase I